MNTSGNRMAFVKSKQVYVRFSKTKEPHLGLKNLVRRNMFFVECKQVYLRPKKSNHT